MNQLGDSPVKDYLVQVNQQLSQQLQQQQRLLEQSQRINQQLTQQLNYSQSLTQESQKINQQQVELLQNYQQLQQLRDKKDPQGWQKLGTQLKNQVGQLWSSLKQWWQQRTQTFNQRSESKQLAGNLRFFAHKMMGTFEKNNQISGDKYTIEKQGNFYQLKAKQGVLLMKFQDQGVFGPLVLESNLNSQQRMDIHHLGDFKKDPLVLSKNSHFFSRNLSSSVPPITEQPELTKDFALIFKGLKHIVDNKDSELNETNRGGFNIKTFNQGKDIMISRSDNGQLVASQRNNGQIKISPTSTINDAQQLKQIVKQAVNKFHQILEQKKTGIKTSKR